LNGNVMQRASRFAKPGSQTHRCCCSTSRRLLDAETAEELVRDVFSATGGKTVLLVTHRPEGLERADRVLRLA